MAETQYPNYEEGWLAPGAAQAPPVSDESWAAVVQLIAGSTVPQPQARLEDTPEGEYYLG